MPVLLGAAKIHGTWGCFQGKYKLSNDAHCLLGVAIMVGI